MNILIIGASGGLGSNISKTLYPIKINFNLNRYQENQIQKKKCFKI